MRLPVALLALGVWLAHKHRLWLRVQLHVWCIQARALLAEGALEAGPTTWLLFQKHVWQLLQLEAARRLEEDVVGKAHLAPGVPHVDTGSGITGAGAGGAGGGSGAGAAPAGPSSGTTATHAKVVCSVWCVVCGVWCVVCGVWGVVCAGVNVSYHLANHPASPRPLPQVSGSMKATGIILKRVVLVGGGHSHAFVVKNFGMKPMPGVHVTLVSKGYDSPYSGMVPGYVAGAYTREECYIDLAKLARFGKAEFVQGEVVGIDVHEKLVYLADGRPPLAYDVVSVDIGSCPQPMDFNDSAIPVTRVKPIDGFGDRWNVLVQRVLATEAPFTLAVVGGGAGGVELVLSMQARLRKELSRVGRPADVLTAVLVTHTPAVLPSHNPTVQRMFTRILAERGVQLFTGRHVTAVRGRSIVCDAGADIEADEVIWCTQASTQAWLQSTGLELHNGFIAVDDHLESLNAPDVFAAGDVALMVNHPRPRAGVFAVRQGPPLAANIRHRLLGEPLEVHIPQTEFLGLISTGLPWCIASKGPMALEGAWLWDLKDWIDRKWMASYTTALPDMAAANEEPSAVAIAAGSSALDALAHAAMRCGGCGSKVGASVLTRVMARLELPPARPEVLVGLDQPDDCAIVRLPDSASGLAAVHTVDFFRSFITDPYVFGQIAANHALSDCHAMCADAVSALAVAVVPYAAEDKMEQTLLQVCVCVCVFVRVVLAVTPCD